MEKVSSSIKLGVIFAVIGHAIFGYAEVWGVDWKVFWEFNDETKSYYDAENIAFPSENIVRVWIKVSYTSKGVAKFVK